MKDSNCLRSEPLDWIIFGEIGQILPEISSDHFRYPENGCGVTEKYRTGMKKIIAGLKGKKISRPLSLIVLSSTPYFVEKSILVIKKSTNQNPLFSLK